MNKANQTALEARIRASLSTAGAGSSDFDLNPGTRPLQAKLRPAAVLIAIRVHDTEPSLILTKRSSALKHHPGQIAFPGGKQDDDDADLTDTALREAWEEIGLPRDAARVLGGLPPHETVTGFRVTPILALIDTDFDLKPETGEVAEVFDVPLTHVLNRENYLVQGRRWRGATRHYYTVPLGPYYIWGATARMLRGWAEAMAQCPS